MDPERLRDALKSKDPENVQKDPSNEENIYANIYPSTTSRALPGCWRLRHIFCRWKGSVYKIMWHELLMYMAGYFLISLFYRCILLRTPWACQNFELFCVHCEQYDQPTPVAILTGFYVSNVVQRWWEQFMAMPWPDQLALKLVASMPGRVKIDWLTIRDYSLMISLFKYYIGLR